MNNASFPKASSWPFLPWEFLFRDCNRILPFATYGLPDSRTGEADAGMLHGLVRLLLDSPSGIVRISRSLWALTLASRPQCLVWFFSTCRSWHQFSWDPITSAKPGYLLSLMSSHPRKWPSSYFCWRLRRNLQNALVTFQGLCKRNPASHSKDSKLVNQLGTENSREVKNYLQ